VKQVALWCDSGHPKMHQRPRERRPPCTLSSPTRVWFHGYVNAQAAIRVWVDDSNGIFRRGLVSCLESAGFQVAGESTNLVPEPDLQQVDVLLFDIEEGGLQRAVKVTRGTKVLLVGLARAAREDTLYDAVESGLAGYLIRSELTPDHLNGCVAAVGAGAGALPPKLLARLFDGMAKGARRGTAAGQLAARELQVLSLLAQGDDTREIAGHLCYSERTVKNIVHDTLVKMNCRTRAQAVAVATRQGFI
jgi:DNA-binding NarL/FixJ family response regulator